MKYIGLLVELILFAFAVYIYLFAIGKMTQSNKIKAADKEKAEAFRQENKSWMKPMSLLLAAILLVEIVLNVKQLLE